MTAGKRKKSESASSMEPSPEPKRSSLFGYFTRSKVARGGSKQAQQNKSSSADPKKPKMGARKQPAKQEHEQEGKTQVCGIFAWATLSFPGC